MDHDRTIVVEDGEVAVLYLKKKWCRSRAWDHLQRNYPPEVPTRQQLGLHTKKYNPWRKRHLEEYWRWVAKEVQLERGEK